MICPKCGIRERKGKTSYCHECWIERGRKRRAENREQINKWYRDYAIKPENRQKHLARVSANRHHKEVQPCSRCGSTENVERHHPDHSKPLEIIWLCRPCHNKEHRQ